MKKIIKLTKAFAIEIQDSEITIGGEEMCSVLIHHNEEYFLEYPTGNGMKRIGLQSGALVWEKAIAEGFQSETVELDVILDHPYMKVLQKGVAVQKKMLDCLEKRIFLGRTGYSSKSEYEKNEIEISEIKTLAETDILKKVISEKEKYYIKFMHTFVSDVEDMNENYERIIAIGEKNKHKNDALKELYANVKWEILDKEVESKLHFYKRVKTHLK